MEKWEIRYKHDKDAQDAQYIVLGISIPEEKYGELEPMRYIWSQYKGSEFWKEFKKRGHTDIDFKKCACGRKG